VEEEWDKLHKLSNWEMLAWIRVGYTPYDADNIATQAVAIKKHTPAVMAATSPSSSASSLFSSSSSSTNLFQRSRPASAVPLVSHLAKAPEPSSRSEKTLKPSARTLSSNPSVASVFPHAQHLLFEPCLLDA
jgi:hypothetical protein